MTETRRDFLKVTGFALGSVLTMKFPNRYTPKLDEYDPDGSIPLPDNIETIRVDLLSMDGRVVSSTKMKVAWELVDGVVEGFPLGDVQFPPVREDCVVDGLRYYLNRFGITIPISTNLQGEVRMNGSAVQVNWREDDPAIRMTTE